jgi:hypothetical protein
VQVFEEEAVFAKPVIASSLRVLIEEPDDVPKDYVYTLDIFCCYDEVIAEISAYL